MKYAVDRIIEDMNHRFLLKVIEDKFKSHDLGSSTSLLLREFPLNRSLILNNTPTQPFNMLGYFKLSLCAC